MGLISDWMFRRQCWHHNPATGRSWIDGGLVDGGRSKHYWCRVCGRYWTGPQKGTARGR